MISVQPEARVFAPGLATVLRYLGEAQFWGCTHLMYRLMSKSLKVFDERSQPSDARAAQRISLTPCKDGQGVA